MQKQYLRYRELHKVRSTYHIRVCGVVQGVGFRPFVYRVAKGIGLFGEVNNDTLGVNIFINATPKEMEEFLQLLSKNTPPLAKIESIKSTQISPKLYYDFTIVESFSEGVTSTQIPPDVSICDACQKELYDPKNRRYLYPFITCTDCGVRYSIIENLPYDRTYTSMKKFRMCKACEAEYNDPLDRRYHAQPIGCWECGPRLSCSIDMAISALKEGKIVAVKGVGGYHLMCDATNEEAIERLRMRKNRPAKPFAVMVKDLEMAKELAFISKKEEEILNAKERPIVLCRSKDILPDSIAPSISKIGIFLPYTPLHLLLLKELDRPLVATSANITDEPIATDLESMEKLSTVYDLLLYHDRDIVNGCDDSVVMVVGDEPIMIRRSRGYAPSSVKLPFKLDNKVLALGANQKSTVAIGFDDVVILSPHIGDLDTIESVGYFEKNINTLCRMYDFRPDVVVHDKHPHYESTKYAKTHYHDSLSVQHHHSHILAVMAEKQMEGKVLGVAFDGTGYGDDGNLWGGEFLLCDYTGFERVAHLKYFKLLGGERAIKEPRRVALSLLFEIYGKELLEMQNPVTKAFSKTELKTLYLSWQKGLNAPLSSSMGRVFDAVASITDICQMMSFEGESGMLLEEMYDKGVKESYPFSIDDKEIDIRIMIEEILHENDPKIAISKFFNTIVEMIVAISEEYLYPVVVSGGVFQNRVLMELLIERIEGLVFSNNIPPNDGGVALGQVVKVMQQ